MTSALCIAIYVVAFSLWMLCFAMFIYMTDHLLKDWGILGLLALTFLLAWFKINALDEDDLLPFRILRIVYFGLFSLMSLLIYNIPGLFGAFGLIITCYTMFFIGNKLSYQIGERSERTYHISGSGYYEGTGDDGCHLGTGPRAGTDYPSSWHGPNDPGGSFDI
jgi:hypothetical protein